MQKIDLIATDHLSIDAETRACLALWAAVFRNGIVSAAVAYEKHDPESPMHRDVRWFFSDDVYPGSFAWLCDLFGYDREDARKRALIKFKALAQFPYTTKYTKRLGEALGCSDPMK